MKTLRLVALIFGLLYGALFVHYMSFDTDTKTKELEMLASRMRHVELSLSFKEPAYKGFVYVP
jgi:hypothetical protein